VNSESLSALMFAIFTYLTLKSKPLNILSLISYLINSWEVNDSFCPNSFILFKF